MQYRYPAFNFGSHLMVGGEVLLDQIVIAGGENLIGRIVRDVFRVNIQAHLDVVEVESLQGNGVQSVGINRLPFYGEGEQLLCRKVIDDMHVVRHLIKLGVAGENIIPAHIFDAFDEIPTVNICQDDPVGEGQGLDEDPKGNDRAHFFFADTSGANHHQVAGAARFDHAAQNVGDKVAHFRFHLPEGMGESPVKIGDYAVVFLADQVLIMIKELVDDGILFAQLLIDFQQLPLVFKEGVAVQIHGKVKPPDGPALTARLDDEYAVDKSRGLREGVGVAADDGVHLPNRVKPGSHLLILQEAHMGHQDGAVDVIAPVAVDDETDFGNGILDGNELRQQLILLGVGQGFVGDNADEQDLYAVYVNDFVGAKQAKAVDGDVNIGRDDGEGGALFQKEQMGQAVVRFMVPQSGDVRLQVVDDLHG